MVDDLELLEFGHLYGQQPCTDNSEPTLVMANRDVRDIRVGTADMKLKAKAKSISGPPSNTPMRQRRRTQTLSFRRTGVSAEVLSGKETFEKKVVEKSEDAKKRIRAFFAKNYLLQHLDQEQAETIVDAVEEIRFNEGDVIINEGEPGEYFYLLEQGAAEVWMASPGSTKIEMVKQYSSGNSFGELALLYNAPRAATVKATTDCVLWAVDRSTFRAILMTTTKQKREMYENFLKEVGVLKALNNYERAAMADVLEPEYFAPKQNIIVERAKGDKFYLLEEGEAEARTQGKVVMQYKRGDYFGELALLNDAPRAATVTALTKCKVVSINRDQFKAKFRFTAPEGLTGKITQSAFNEALRIFKKPLIERLLGKLEDILQRSKEAYEQTNAETAVSANEPLVQDPALPAPPADDTSAPSPPIQTADEGPSGSGFEASEQK